MSFLVKTLHSIGNECSTKLPATESLQAWACLYTRNYYLYDRGQPGRRVPGLHGVTTSVLRQGRSNSKASSHPSLAERFWAKVEKTESCWNWLGALNQGGYGVIRDQPGAAKSAWVVKKAPWVSYELHTGSIPEGLSLVHSCHNRRCVRPDHLTIDPRPVRAARGRPKQPDRTHCLHGHEFTAANSYYYQGKLFCRRCKRQHSREARARQKSARSRQ